MYPLTVLSECRWHCLFTRNNEVQHCHAFSDGSTLSLVQLVTVFSCRVMQLTLANSNIISLGRLLTVLSVQFKHVIGQAFEAYIHLSADVGSVLSFLEVWPHYCQGVLLCWPQVTHTGWLTGHIVIILLFGYTQLSYRYIRNADLLPTLNSFGQIAGHHTTPLAATCCNKLNAATQGASNQEHYLEICLGSTYQSDPAPCSRCFHSLSCMFSNLCNSDTRARHLFEHHVDGFRPISWSYNSGRQIFIYVRLHIAIQLRCNRTWH